jgi:hypothetical protein
MSEPEELHMTTWKPIEDAPRNERPVLLWARLKNSPPTGQDFHPIVGFWHRFVQQWKVSPEHLNEGEELIPSYWMELPNSPPPKD